MTNINLNISPQAIQIIQRHSSQNGVTPSEFVDYVLIAYHEAMAVRQPVVQPLIEPVIEQPQQQTMTLRHKRTTVPRKTKQPTSLTSPRATKSRFTRI